MLVIIIHTKRWESNPGNFGFLTLGRKRSGEPHTQEDVKLLTTSATALPWPWRTPACTKSDWASCAINDALTPRELEVLKLIAQGHSNKEIAQRLCISQKTVKNHINNIFSKLHLYDRTQAMLYAIRTGLVKID